MIALADSSCTFTLVICTFNRAEHLRDVLKTALNQDTGGQFRYEVLVVDNNSSDATREVVDRYLADGHSNLRYLFEERQGKSYALNSALAAVRGAYYTIVDDDFILPARWLADLFDGIRQHPDVSFLSGKVLPSWGSAPPPWLTREHWSAIAMADYGEQEFRTSLDNQICLLACTFRTDDVKRVGGYDPRLGVTGNRIGGVEDLDILLRLWKAGKEGVYLPRVAFLHKVEPERLTKRYHRRWHRGHGRSYAIMRDPATEGRSRILDVPRYMYREALASAARTLLLSLSRRQARAFTAETRLWFIVGFMAERLRQRLRGERPDAPR